MSNIKSSDPALVGELVIRAADLPDEDLRMVVEFATRLAEARQLEQTVQAQAILKRAKDAAERTHHKSRAELFAELEDIGERIRAQAISKGTAHNGDWQHD